MGVTICFEHVKGHQDNNQSASTLPCFTQLNILADQLAKQALLQLLQHHQHQVGLLVGDSWSLYVNNQAVSSNPQPCIIWYLIYHLAYQYMVTKKHYISPGGFPLINFHALSRSLKSTSPLYHLWYLKFVPGHSATGQMMCLWGKWDTAVIMTLKPCNMF